MTRWERRVPRWKLVWYRLRYGVRRHPWDYACDDPGCGCCEPLPTGRGWTRLENTRRAQ